MSETTSIGASTVVFDDDGRVLIVQRAKPPFEGRWSLPGGHIEPGETAEAAARREVGEETGIEVTILGHLTHFDVPQRDGDGRIVRTFGLEVFFGRVAGEQKPVASGDVRDARFVPVSALSGYPLTERCAELIGEAVERLRAADASSSEGRHAADRNRC